MLRFLLKASVALLHCCLPEAFVVLIILDSTEILWDSVYENICNVIQNICAYLRRGKSCKISCSKILRVVWAVVRRRLSESVSSFYECVRHIFSYEIICHY